MDAHAIDRARRAIEDEDEDALRAALAAGADPNASVVVPHPYFIPLIVWVAVKGLPGMCTLLVAAGADVHAAAGLLEADHERSALNAAISGESHEHVVTDANVACVRILLEAGADPNTRIRATAAGAHSRILWLVSEDFGMRWQRFARVFATHDAINL